METLKTPEEVSQQSLKQQKIVFANEKHDAVLVEILKDCMGQNILIAETEFKTIVNAITLDVQSNLLRRVVDYLEEIRKGSLHEIK